METVNVSLFGHDPKVQKAVSTAKNVSVTKAPVLVSGEAELVKEHSPHLFTKTRIGKWASGVRRLFWGCNGS